MKKSTIIKSQNTRSQNLALYGTKAQQHKRFKNIAKELSDRHISLGDIADPNSPKQYTLMDIAQQEGMTLGEMTVLRQYAKAIYEGDTRAAEFVRDTAGEKPTQDVTVVSEKSPIESLSDEELLLLINKLKEE